MTNDDTIKQRNIDIAEGLYREFKATATREGKTLRAAFAEALQSYIAGQVDPRKSSTSVGSKIGGIAPASDLAYISVQGLSQEQIQKVEAFIRLVALGDQADELGELTLQSFDVWAKYEDRQAGKIKTTVNQRKTGNRRTG